MNWHYVDVETTVGPVAEPEFQALVKSGKITRDTLVWHDGLDDWKPYQDIAPSFSPGAPPAPTALCTECRSSFFQSELIQYQEMWVCANCKERFFQKVREGMTVEAAPPFRDSTRLTKWLKGLLFANVGIAILSVISEVLNLQWLTTHREGFLQGEFEDLSWNDIQQFMVGSLGLFIYIPTAVLFLRWIHRANYNARALGAVGMRFTPGWSIGYYFIPFLNLVRPYQAMKEIWQASLNPPQWADERVPSLLGLWWFLWLASNILGQAAFRFSVRARTWDQLATVSYITLAASIMDVFLSWVALRMISQIYQMQMRHASTLPVPR